MKKGVWEEELLTDAEIVTPRTVSIKFGGQIKGSIVRVLK